MKKNITPVILCGGYGTRLWPLSRKNHPKQFLSLFGQESLFIKSIKRARGLSSSVTDPIVICNENHKFLVKKYLNDQEIPYQKIIVEPTGRNTAPAILLSSMYIRNKYGDDQKIIFLPADQEIKIKKGSLSKTLSVDPINNIYLFGITPSYPSDQYGYIKRSSKDLTKNMKIFSVERFTEKPNKLLAKKFLKSKRYLWNSGIFFSNASTFCNSYKKIIPVMYKSISKAIDDGIDESLFFYPSDEFSKAKNISFDYQILEKVSDTDFGLKLIQVDASWIDLGSYSSLLKRFSKNKKKNAFHGKVFSSNSKNSFVYSENTVTAISNIDNIAVVNTPDVTLVAKLDDASNLKDVMKKVSKKYPAILDDNLKVYRPWGYYIVLEESEYHKVKRIAINPGASLSLQMHEYRSEHWVVINGTATVTSGHSVRKYSKNESTYIPAKTKHSLKNDTDDLLEIIEVQVGSYLGEDDIKRFRDIYGRAVK